MHKMVIGNFHKHLEYSIFDQGVPILNKLDTYHQQLKYHCTYFINSFHWFVPFWFDNASQFKSFHAPKANAQN